MRLLNNVYSTDEVQKLLGYTNKQSVYNAVRLGRIPKPIEYSGVWMFKKRDIENHIKKKVKK